MELSALTIDNQEWNMDSRGWKNVSHGWVIHYYWWCAFCSLLRIYFYDTRDVNPTSKIKFQKAEFPVWNVLTYKNATGMYRMKFFIGWCSTRYVICMKRKYIFHFYYDSSTSPTLFSSKELADSCKICYSMIKHHFLHYFQPAKFHHVLQSKKKYINLAHEKNVCSQKKEAIYFDSIVEWNLLSIMMLLNGAQNYKSFSTFSLQKLS